ncbi:tetratricopeptide repeat protein [Ancylobacter sp. TS-1]|uniref:tetratricopeptide repeat protein n=1 Tax=Ancylobacter sp. TS-1 TaxID=1850374 RepID=UPI001265C27A|nr:tetratricopeptide repeat protein [Ancylobacter sp. TS-1]QFR32844.1 sel1 repeat family protein [Ancylobacter sp. TS-1]
MRDEWISFTDIERMGPELLRERISEAPATAARWIEAAALNGLVNAQIAWGQMLVDGHGVPRDPEAGLRWFRVAADSGSADGINMVGRCHELGWGTPADPAEAARHYRRAAEAGHAWAPFNLATLLLHGSGVAPDRREALGWYLRAARRGNAKAMSMVGRYLELGWDRPARPAAALRWYARGAAGEDYRGLFDHARLTLELTGRLDHAREGFARAIGCGVPAFCRNVADALRAAPYPELHRLALRALERAAESGEPADLRRYAAALAEGLGGLPDPDGAAAAFRRAREAEQALLLPRAGPRDPARRPPRPRGFAARLLRRLRPAALPRRRS